MKIGHALLLIGTVFLFTLGCGSSKTLTKSVDRSPYSTKAYSEYIRGQLYQEEEPFIVFYRNDYSNPLTCSISQMQVALDTIMEFNNDLVVPITNWESISTPIEMICSRDGSETTFTKSFDKSALRSTRYQALPLQRKDKSFVGGQVKVGEKIFLKGEEEALVDLEFLGNDFDFPPAPPVTKERLPKEKVAEVLTEKIPLAFDKEGLYSIRFGGREMTLLSVSESYPKLTKAKELAETLRYVTRNKEYNKIISAENVKKAIDEFWIEKAGSEERARVLIREFYGRVEKSNRFFTYRKPGWMTDRGMVFIVYGQPDNVEFSKGKERWTFRDYLGSQKLEFDFIVDGDHVELRRDPRYMDSWNQAIHNWRSGVISKLSL